MKIKQLQWVLFATTATMLASCTKEVAYDGLTKSDGIDLSVSISKQGLTIPIGSVDKVYLTELIKDDSTNISIIDDDVFCIYKEGDFEKTVVSIGIVNFDYIPEIEPRVFKLKVANDLDMATKMMLATKSEGETLDGLDQIVDLTCKDIYIGDTAKLANYAIESYNVDQGLLEVNTATFAEPLTTSFSMEITNLPNKEVSYEVIMKKFAIHLPDYVVAYNAKTGKIYKDGIIDDLGRNGEEDIKHIKKVGEDFITWKSDDIILTGANFAVPLKNNEGTIFRSDTIIMTSEILLPEVPMLGSELSVAIENGEKIIQYKEQVVVYSGMERLKGKMAAIEGRFFPQVDPFNKNVVVDVESSLDFLKKKENDVKLNVKNPIIDVTLTNPCDIKLFANANVDTHNGKPIQFQDLMVTPKAGEDSICIRLTATDGNLAENTYASAALSSFIEPFPDEFDLRLDIYSDSVNIYPFQLGKDLYVKAKYKVSVPFEFNSIHFIYDKVAEDVFSEDITDYVSEIHDAIVTMDIESTLPIDTEIKITGRDQDGIEAEGLVKSSTISIDRCTANSVTRQSVEIHLSIPDISKVKDLVIKVIGQGEDCTLKSTQYLKFDNIQLKLSQLNLDLNDK